MTRTAWPARELSRSECLALLAGADVGRLVFTEGALPAVLPVSFALDGARVVLRMCPHGSLVTAVDRAVVAFQVDEVDRPTRTGWNVVVIGEAHVVRDPVECERLSSLPLVPWAAGDRDVVVVVPAELLSGGRLGGPDCAHGPSAG